MYYDREKSFSLLSNEEVTTKLLTDRQPIILDNMLSSEGRFYNHGNWLFKSRCLACCSRYGRCTNQYIRDEWL